MDVRRNHASTSVRTEGGLLPSDLLEKIRAAEPDVPGLTDADFGLKAGERSREATTRSWNRLVGSWAALEAIRVGTEANDPLVGPTRDRFLLPLFEELGFGRLPVARAAEIEGTSYPIRHNWEGRVPVHLVGYGVELDSRTKGVRGAAGAAPHALVQEYLNRTDEALWGIVSNGRSVRLLRDSTSLTRQAYVEFDLEAIFEGELYADFALLWSVLHRSRFEGEKPADCLLERWTKKAADDGTRALDKLRGGVEKAIETLGAGFLATKGNHALVQALRSGELDPQDYYRELLRLVYRLIFLFTAEDRHDEETGRELLLDPNAPEAGAERYRRYYSTARLRSLAGRRRGSRHPDLWMSLRRVVAALGSDGAPTLALPALGSLLFGSGACPHLDASDLENEALLDAVRALATIEEDRRLRLVDYRNIGAEELGGIYEGLLELHPRIELDANPPRFSLDTAAGNERKSTGSYYTPSSLINCLLDSALDPVVDEAVKGKSGSEAEAAILDLSVVDPAAGSGHFLIAAAHRLAKRLAAARSGEGEPPPAQVRHALRDVISRCIYAVDINPMAVELCKLSLWLEALEPGRPLSFLDAHIKCGNSLLGATPELVAAGIPDAAFEAIAGDDKAVVRDWKKVNASERVGQYSLFGVGLEDPVGRLAEEARALEELPEDSPAGVLSKAAHHTAYLKSAVHVRPKSALDAWCAAFVVAKVSNSPAITTATVRTLATTGSDVPAATHELIDRTAAEYAFFHWPLEFPVVFDAGGFDVVLGNPPWERIKLQEKEYFAARSPAVAGAKSASERKRMIEGLSRTDPALWESYRTSLRRAEGEGHVLRNSGRYPLTARGDINTYAVFAELMRWAVGPRGRMGIVVPTGIATDDSTKHFFRELVDGRVLVSLYGFRNDELLFAAVNSDARFCALTVAGASHDHPPDLIFFATSTAELADAERHFSLTPTDLALLSPNTRTCPTFRYARDAELAKSIYRRVPVLIDEQRGVDGNPWGLSFMTMFHMTNDSGLFREEPGQDRLPLYEAKLVHLFSHRWATYEGPGLRDTTITELADPDHAVVPRWWVEASHVDERLDGRWARTWLAGWRGITNTRNERTVIPCVIPRAAAGNSIYLAMSTDPLLPLLPTIMSSMVVDWVGRQKISGQNFNLFIALQLPLLPPSALAAPEAWSGVSLADWLRRCAVELTYTTHDLGGFARDLGWVGQPFRWDPRRRHHIQAEVDGCLLHAYGLDRQQAEYLLDSFDVLRRREEQEYGTFRTRDLVLDAYDAISRATADLPFVSRLDPPPGDPRAAHPPRPGETPGHWVPWSEVPVPEMQAPATRPTRVAAAPAAISTAAIAARVVPEPAPSLFAADPASAWRPEAAVNPSEIALGARVRHRAKGEGTVLSARPSGKRTELLIRFDATGEAWIVFGYGVLEFQQ